MNEYRRGHVWFAYAGSGPRRSQSGTRPVIIISSDPFNRQPFPVVFAVPCTTTDWLNPLHVPIAPPEGGLREPSFAMCDFLLPVSRDLLIKQMGDVSPDTLSQIAERLREILDV